MTDNVYDLFREAPKTIGDRQDEYDDTTFAADCLDRIDSILSSKKTPYARMLAEICSVVDEWKAG